MLFTGSHDANALAVANKQVDAATIADRILDAAVAKGLVKREDIQVVWRSDPIPESPTVWRKNLLAGAQGQDQGRLPRHQGHHLGRPGQAEPLRGDQRRRPTTSSARPPSSLNIDLKKQKYGRRRRIA